MPEVADGLVEIVNVAREPGYRSKIAVVSHADGVDPVGACVGPRGSRVRMVVSELRGEKIDIIPFNEEPARFVAKALSPARVREVLVDDDDKQATVVVPDDQLSLAIGKEGQNARLAARLTGWRVDIKSETEFAEEEAEMGYDEEEVDRPLPRGPHHRQALPERRAAGLALLRPAGAPGARRTRTATTWAASRPRPRQGRPRRRSRRGRGGPPAERRPRPRRGGRARARPDRRGAEAEEPAADAPPPSRATSRAGRRRGAGAEQVAAPPRTRPPSTRTAGAEVEAEPRGRRASPTPGERAA